MNIKLTNKLKNKNIIIEKSNPKQRYFCIVYQSTKTI